MSLWRNNIDQTMDFVESFGQRVDLCGRLREILGSYPEGTSILRELIQNAVRGCTGLVLALRFASAPVVGCATLTGCCTSA